MKHLFELRKDLHRIPEIAFKEFKTTDYIVKRLEKLPGLVIHQFPFTGMLVEYSQGDGDYRLFRAEMDALPITEKTKVDFSSEHNGYMHACGHDIHLTILIGLIEYVVNHQLKLNLLFLFQPAEEGFGGALKVLNTSILDKFSIKEAYALHVHPNYKVGTVASKSGILFGIPQEFDLVFQGKSSHCANPQKGNDAIASAANFLATIHSRIARSLSPTEARLCHIGKIAGGDVRNVVAESCRLEGTLRSFTTETMDKLRLILKSSAESSALHFGCRAEVNFLTTYDPVVNDQKLYHKLRSSLPSNIDFVEIEAALTGEDFGYFTTKYSGLMFWIGAGISEADLHSPYFLPDESAILTGLEAFISLLR